MNANAKNLQIKTVSVSLQVITLGDKQMTLSVFRQIPEGNAFLHNGKLKQEIYFWGKVRYQISKDGPDVWAIGVYNEKLFRYPIDLPSWAKLDDKKPNRWIIFNYLSRDEWESASSSAYENYCFLQSLPQLYIAV